MAALRGIHGKQLYCCCWRGQTQSDGLCVFKAFHHFYSIHLCTKHWCYRYISFTFTAAYTDPRFKLNKVFPKITLTRYWEALTSRSSSSIPSLLLQAECNPKQVQSLSSYQFCYPHQLSNPQTRTSPSNLTCTSPGVAQLLFTGRRKETQ